MPSLNARHPDTGRHGEGCCLPKTVTLSADGGLAQDDGIYPKPILVYRGVIVCPVDEGSLLAEPANIIIRINYAVQ